LAINGTEAGTETSGSASMSGMDYISHLTRFIMALEMDMTSTSVVSLSLTITSVKTTLTNQQIKVLAALEGRMSSIQTAQDLLIVGLQTKFSNITGENATSVQIASGPTTATTATAAAKTYLVALQSLMVNSHALKHVGGVLSKGSHSEGPEITEQEFIIRMKRFLYVLHENAVSTEVAALSASLLMVKVTFNDATNMTRFEEAIAMQTQRLDLAITFYQNQFESLTGAEATEEQMKTGDTTASLSKMAASKVHKLKSLSMNKFFVKKTKMLCTQVSKDALAATSAGNVESTVMEMNDLVMSLFHMISEDFLAEDLNNLFIKIQSAKLTEPLTEVELTAVEFVVARLETLEGHLGGAGAVFSTQYSVITGSSIVIIIIEVPTNPPSMMTTRGPGSMMTTGGPGSMMTTHKPSSMMATKSHTMMTTKSPMMTTQSHAMMTTMSTGGMMTTMSSSGGPGDQVEVEVFVEVLGPGVGHSSQLLDSKKRRWLRDLMKNAFAKYN